MPVDGGEGEGGIVGWEGEGGRVGIGTPFGLEGGWEGGGVWGEGLWHLGMC